VRCVSGVKSARLCGSGAGGAKLVVSTLCGDRIYALCGVLEKAGAKQVAELEVRFKGGKSTGGVLGLNVVPALDLFEVTTFQYAALVASVPRSSLRRRGPM
jgi:hypothetical protein